MTWSKRLLSRDEAGVETWFHSDDSTGEIHIQTVQDVEPILEANKALANAGNNGYGQSREFRHVAAIPNIFIEKWLRDDGVDVYNAGHWDGVKRKLNDPDWRFLKTIPGRV